MMKRVTNKVTTVNEVQSLTTTLRNRNITAELCIYRVPEKLRKVKEDAYKPLVVSIGPLHRNEVYLAPMLQHKLHYTATLLNLNPQVEDQGSNKWLEKCIETIQGLDKMIRRCYIEEIDCTDYELAEMMLVDGCFILELFLRFDRTLNYMKLEDKRSDPVLKSAWNMTALKHDLALLENQIPFFILEILYNAIRPRIKNSCDVPESVISLALSFFKPMSKKTRKEEPLGTECRHLLDLLHRFYFLPSSFSGIDNDLEQNTGLKNKDDSTTHLEFCPAKQKWGFNHCASKLLESGVKFRVATSTAKESLLDIDFNQQSGEIHMPKLLVHDATSFSLLRNLIAFEQCSLNSTNSVTSYAFLMRSLISSSRDSQVLEKIGIIEHISNGDEGYLANRFQSILEGVDLMDDFRLREVCDKVNKYHKSWYSLIRLGVFFRKQRRILWANYLSSAWKVMSILAAVIILIFTSLQTYYTIHPRN
ncbi:UPF0481 protein At3g47200-like [Argentina anserina]|uniref:UPF0481 protein At3g47200-like n=1 Tax=Argentina anserina TaxID=57926 RepID=UPI00217632BA|nr:UPF0481 protein At3g47200-like [Potentilla anserina]